MGDSAREVDRLVLEERTQTLGSELTTDARFLVSTEGGAELDPVAVQRQAPRAHLAGDAHSPVQVLGPHASRQAVLRVVGDADSVVVIVKRDHNEHGAEDLVLGYPHGVVDVGEDRRLQVPALRLARGPAAAHGDRRTFLSPTGDVALDALPLAFRYQRADLGRGIMRIADSQLGSCLGDRIDDHLVAAAMSEDPCLRQAMLAGHHDRERHEGWYDAVDVGVLEDDGGRFSPALEGDPFELLAAECGDTSAYGRAARETDLVDQRVLHKRLAVVPVGRHDVQYTRG